MLALSLTRSLAIGAAALTCVAATGCANSAVATNQGHPVAVELFTSQGCSSCPPADAVMRKLANDPNVVAITRPVTYWDDLGWKDTLARPANTALQRAYAQHKFSGGGVYTPQMVVEGRAGTVGGREDQVRHLIAEAARLPEPALAIGATPDGGRIVKIDGRPPAATTVSLVALRGLTTVSVGGGENGGRSVSYANAVISETLVGAWRGGAKRFTVPASALKVAGARRYALVVRQGDAGPILAARYL